MAASDTRLMQLSAHIVSAYVASNRLSPADLPQLIEQVHGALRSLGRDPEPEAVPLPLIPAVSIRKSITPQFLICLEDGRQFRTLKRHIFTKYDLTPDQYRAKWGLPPDYPMVAPAYAERRSALAKSMGLGRKAGSLRGRSKQS